MNWVAWKMLNGDPVKYLGTVFGVGFGVLLIAQQCSIFVGIILRTANPIADVREAQIWVMDPYLQNADEIKPLSDSDLYRIRGVEGVDWAVKIYKGLARAKIETGNFRQVILMGVDDQSLIGAPVKMIEGDIRDLKRPDAIVMDQYGYKYLWPNEPFKVGREVEMNDRRAVIVGICDVSAPFQSFPVVFTRYSQAVQFVASERQQLSFVVAAPRQGYQVDEVCRLINEQTRSIGEKSGLIAMPYREFVWINIKYYLENTGIPVNFGITITLGFIVGTAIAGQTFYLFTIENLKQFGALKAMGVTNWGIVGMIGLQASVVGVIGLSIGLGLTALFFVATTRLLPDLRGLHLMWEIAGGTCLAVTLIICLASALSLRKVLTLEPAVVFR
ncbi:FtsX-like permease family protein [Planctopirus ephydatiae]|uniref:FtsX-like permease family protein n=1 Tax=Planctopirus ephydatiae TaxID=2528019 RepID=A0A518GLA7_9PLAN|nr:ABC transporter permease [Planctopirus ephydatiae]QDV29359.1 FtsX-like permease family protein [Planctopirus ephydatiae]